MESNRNGARAAARIDQDETQDSNLQAFGQFFEYLFKGEQEAAAQIGSAYQLDVNFWSFALFNAAYEAVLVCPLTPDGTLGTFVAVNDVAQAYVGYSRDELLAMGVQDLVAPGEVEVEGIIRQVRAQRRFVFEADLVRKDRTLITLEVQAYRFGLDGQEVVVMVCRDVGERQRAEAAQAHLAAIVESSRDAIIGKTLEGIITSWNRAAEQIYGYTADEIIGRSIKTLAPPERHAEIDEIHRSIGRGESVPPYETVRVTKDGRRLDISLTVSPIMDSSGAIIGASAIGRDITRRKQTEEAFRESHTILTAVTEGTDDAVYVKDRYGRYLMINRAGAEALGQPVEGVIGKHDAELMPEETGRRLMQLDKEVMASGESHLAEEVVTTPAGPRIFQSVKAPYLDAKGDVVGIIGISRDITEQKAAEERNQFQAHILSQVNDGVVAIDSEWRITYLNDAFAAMIGIDTDEALGQHISDLYSYRWVSSEVAEAARAALAEGNSWKGEIVMIRQDGEEIETESNVRVLTDEHGREVGRLAVIRDISERKRAERETDLLAKAGNLLAVSLDYQETLQGVAGMIVPTLADWCAIDLQSSEGGLERVAVAHMDPEKVQLAETLQQHYPPDPDALHGPPNVIRTGHSEFIPEVEPALLHDVARDEEHARILTELGLHSAMIVPLIARGRTLGALTLVNAETSHRFTEHDLELAEELARRCALSVDNARLYHEAQSEIARHRETQEALRESERMLRFTLDASRVGTWNWDFQAETVEWSENLEAIHRMTPGTFDGTFEAFLEDVEPEDRDAVRQAIEAAIETGDDYHVEYRLPLKDGHTYWVEGKGTVIFDEAGEPLRMAGICMDITERKQAEEDLRRSGEEFRTLSDAIPQHVWTADPKGRINHVSDRVLEYFDRSYDAMISEGWSEVVHPDDLATTLERWTHALQTGEPYENEFRLRRHDGTYRWHLARALPLWDQEGRIVKWFGTNTDITERKTTEQALREKTRTLETINEINTSLAAQLDLERLVQAVTDAGTELSGAEFGAFFYNVLDDAGESYMLYALSRAPREAFAQFPMPRNTDIFAPTFQGEGIVRIDDVTSDPRYGNNPPYNGMPDGHLPVRSYLAVPVVGRSGETLGGLFFGHSEVGVFTEQDEDVVSGIASQAAIAIENARLFDAARRELEERRRIQQALQESEARFRMMADTAPVLIWMAGLDKQYMYFNRVWLEFTGRSLDEELGFGWTERVHPDDVERCVEVYTTAFDAREPFEVEYRLRRHDGVYRWILDHGTPRFTPEHTFAGYIGSCIDITERKVAETQLKALNDTLEQRVVERTAALEDANEHLTREISERRRAEHELEHINELLTQRNRELQDFAYVASHDLQEPLRKISAFSDLIRTDYGEILDGDGLDYLGRMQKAALRMSGLINDLLAFSRIATRGNSFEKIDLNGVVNEVVFDLEVSIQESGGTVEVEPLPTIEADLTQMRQLFQNLISNAIKFRRDDVPPVVRVAGRIEPGAGEEAVPVAHLSVADNGIGFEEQFHERIFAPFQRLHGRSAYPGSGIGLAICRRIVERHGGTIKASSTLGEGSTFHITLPARHDS